MTTVAIIPARGGSVGIPRKNLMPLCDRPLLEWSIRQAQRSTQVDEVWVSSDDEEILNFAASCGAHVVKRPPDLSTGHATSESALIHFLDHWDSLNGPDKTIDYLVFLQATSPLRTEADIDGAITQMRKAKADSLFSGARLDDFCIWSGNEASGYQSVNYDHKQRGMRDSRAPMTLENGSIYVMKPNVLRENNNRIGGKVSVYFMPYWQSYEIDEPKDVDIVEWHMRHKLLDMK